MGEDEGTEALAAASEAGDGERPDAAWRAGWAAAIAPLSPEAVRAWCRLRWAEAEAAPAHRPVSPGVFWGVAPVAAPGTAAQLAEGALRLHRAGRNRLAAAAVEALAEIALAPAPLGREAIAELGRLRARLAHRGLARRVGRALAAVAAARGLAPDVLQDLAVTDGGLGADGTRTWAAGPHDVYLFLTDDGEADLAVFERATGRALGAGLGADFRAMQEARAVQRALGDALQTEKARLEAALVAQRAWPAAAWAEVFAAHPLMRALAARLVWAFDGRTAMPAGPGWTDAAGAPAPGPAGPVRLMHPALADPAEVAAWRARIVERRVVQPFKQAFREAVRPEGPDPGARFDGLAVRLRTLGAVLRARGWVGLGGAGPAGNVARRDLPGHDLAAVLTVRSLNHHRDPHRRVVALGRVGFVGPGGRPAAEVPPAAWAEALRDVALAAAVAPAPAPEPEGLRAAALAEVVAARAALLDALLPQLGLDAVATIAAGAAWIALRGHRLRLDLLTGEVTLDGRALDLDGFDRADLPLYVPHEGADAATGALMGTLMWLAKLARR